MHGGSIYSAGGGRILFVRNDDLYAQRLDRQKRKLEGDPELIVQGVASALDIAYFSVSRSGALAWRPGKAALPQLTTLDRTGKQIGVTGPTGMITSYVSLSPDESHLLTGGPGGASAWLMEPDRPGRLSAGPFPWGLWSPDGLRILGGGDFTPAIMERPVSGAGLIQRVADLPGGANPTDISPDGKLALLCSRTSGLYSVRLDGPVQERVPKLVAETGELVLNARFSPDGRWVVYQGRTTENQRLGIFVQPFPGPGLRRQISSHGGYPVWRKDGKEIIFYDQNQIWSIRVDSVGAELRFSAPQTLFPVRPPAGLVAPLTPLAITRDGSRIFFPQDIEQPDTNMIHIMTGWLRP